ncbi:MAG: purine-nucleoside phosphorylase [Acidimicrobiales bacterium]
MPTTRPGAHGANPFEQARLAARELARVAGVDHFDAVVLLGNGLSAAAPLLGADGPGIDLSNLPWFARMAGRPVAWSLRLGDDQVLVVTGPAPASDDPVEVVHPVRTAMAAGAGTVVVVTGATAVDPSLPHGAVLAIADHLTLASRSPLGGVAPEGSPFVDMTDAWSPRLRALAHDVEPDLGEVVYAQVEGPQLPTPAERRMLAGLGADLVGMWGVLEVIAARHLGGEVLGLAVVTDRLVPDAVAATAPAAAGTVARIVTGVLDRR